MDKMDIETYGNELVNKIKKDYPDLVVNLTTVTKNNNIKLTGITIRKKDVNVAPNIYINAYYDRDLSLEETEEKVMELYEANKSSIDFDINSIMDFNLVKDKIVARVSNKKSNENTFDDYPYAQFGDLIVNFYILVENNESGVASIKITNQLLNSWKINLSKLLEYAYKNTSSINPLVIESIVDVLKEMYSRHGEVEIPTEMFDAIETETPMYVVSNQTRQFGAFFITDREALKTIGEKLNDDFWIIPSSIHELIAVPYSKVDDENTLKDMVREVNANEVAPEEVLADNIYFYSRKDETICGSDKKVIPFLS